MLLLITTAAHTEGLSGRAVQVISGNRIVLIGSHQTHYRLRLTGIETPQLGKQWDHAARRFLATLVLGRLLNFHILGEDPDGYLEAKVLYGGSDLSLRLIQAGLAVHRPDQPSPIDADRYVAAEKNAKRARQGMWSQTVNHPRRAGKLNSGRPAHGWQP